MPAYYDEKTKSWYVKCYYEDYTGTRKQKMKRGFQLQRDAREWERSFILQQSAQPSMPFQSLAELYLKDKKEHTKLITYQTKKSRIDNWILPYFGKKPVDSITAVDIRKWQSDLKNAVNAKNEPLSPGYMQNLVTELSSLFNFAVRFYGLSVNPCQIAGNAVGHKNRSINFWTKQEFDSFIETFDKSSPFYLAFLILYYCGIRIGELEALTVEDADLRNNTLRINKTLHLINGKRVITEPKTKKSNRVITMPLFLSKCIERHIARLYAPEADTRLFMATPSSYAKQLDTHAGTAGIKRIRVHDLRHSHASLLIELGFSALLVSERLGHESVSTTLNIYSHLFPSKQSEVAERLEKLCEKDPY